MDIAALFARFLAAINLTPRQRADGETSARAVIAAVSRAYWWDEKSHGYIIGGYGKDVAVRPPRDVDVLTPLPWDVKRRIDGLTGNVQSRLLAEVRSKLLVTYPRTVIRADGPTVIVPFQAFAVEVLPGFEYDYTRYLVPLTRDGGKWGPSEPWGEIVNLNYADEASAGAARRLVQMLKVWQREHDVPLKSLHLELLAVEFLTTWKYRAEGMYWYDGMIRDFFSYLTGRANTFLSHPCTGESFFLWNDWLAKARSAQKLAAEAFRCGLDDLPYTACGKWQDLFGNVFPDPQ